jgi:hypothetical protein
MAWIALDSRQTHFNATMTHTAGALVRSRATTPVALRRGAVALSVVLALQSAGVSAQSRAEEGTPDTPSPSPSPSSSQALYKGVVGNLLEAVPIDPESRVQLQRFSAVVGSPLSGHSLAITLGIAAPPLMILGFIWGLWSANQIQPAQALTDGKRAPGPQNAAGPAAVVAVQDRPSGTLRPTTTPQQAEDPGAALDRLVRRADASALATVIGGASAIDPTIPCENCIMPMLYFRPAPDVR